MPQAQQDLKFHLEMDNLVARCIEGKVKVQGERVNQKLDRPDLPNPCTESD